MTTTETTAPTAPQPELTAVTVLVPVNDEGIVILDGTPAESALKTLFALDQAIEALDAQRTAAKATIKAVMGNRAVATLGGAPVVNWTWSSTTTVNGALLKAMSREIWSKVTRTTPRRPFNVTKNRIGL